MDSIYNKKLSFGSLFQFDENVIIKSNKLDTPIKKINIPIKKINIPTNTNGKPEKPNILEGKKSELDKELEKNPFFFT